MTKKEMLQQVDEKVQDWLWDEYIPGFDSKEDMANNAVVLAAVMCMSDMIHNYICDPYTLDDEEEIDNLFWKDDSLQEFYDFFLKYNLTLRDIAETWLMGNDPETEDILGLHSWNRQLDDMLNDIHWLLEAQKDRR